MSERCRNCGHEGAWLVLEEGVWGPGEMPMECDCCLYERGDLPLHIKPKCPVTWWT